MRLRSTGLIVCYALCFILAACTANASPTSTPTITATATPIPDTPTPAATATLTSPPFPPEGLSFEAEDKSNTGITIFND